MADVTVSPLKTIRLFKSRLEVI